MHENVSQRGAGRGANRDQAKGGHRRSGKSDEVLVVAPIAVGTPQQKSNPRAWRQVLFSSSGGRSHPMSREMCAHQPRALFACEAAAPLLPRSHVTVGALRSDGTESVSRRVRPDGAHFGNDEVMLSEVQERAQRVRVIFVATYLCNRACRMRSAAFGGPARPVAMTDISRC